jgi:uncharacterized iron-regulated membrane protein
MAWLHTWVGLLLGWLLFAMFVTGTSAYFHDEITRWMQPEITGTADPAKAAVGAAEYLKKEAGDARSWFISLPNGRGATSSAFWRPQTRKPGMKTSAVLDENGEAASFRDTKGGYFLYRFHFDLHYMPVLWARYIVGVAAMLMLVALLTGVVTHKKIFVDFFTMRTGKGQRSWLDAHNMTGVFALPFFIMITYTGLVTLATMYMPWGIAANYSSPTAFFNEKFPSAETGERTGNTVELAPLAPMIALAHARWGGAQVGVVQVFNPGDETARVILSRGQADSVNVRGPSVTFNGATGEMISARDGTGAAVATEGVMIGLHAGRYADTGLRWLYFLSGVVGTAMVGSGLVLWTVKRRARLPDPARPHLGFRLVEKLNICVIAGLGAGLAGYFLANRLLPLDLPDRANAEINSLFAIWGGMLVWAILRPGGRAWTEGLCFAAILFAAVPLVNALTTERHFLASLMAGDMLFVGFDLVMVMLALGYAVAARVAARKTGAPPARKRRTGPTEGTAR